MSAAVRRYFVDRYPARSAGRAGWFRAGEAARQAVIAPWLEASAGGSLLDVGTGDGAFLSSVLCWRPTELALVDLSPRAVAEAAATLAGRAASIRAVAGDVHDLALPRADVVVAWGVTDYSRDWARLLGRLRWLTRRWLIVDFPRAGTGRSALRRCWLWRHGLSLHTASLAGVRAATRGLGQVEVAATRLHWLARIAVGGGRHA